MLRSDIVGPVEPEISQFVLQLFRIEVRAHDVYIQGSEKRR
jgi:hypothetical protein